MAALFRALVTPWVDRLLRASRPAEKLECSGIGLALGGGFARGFAHLGVLKVLEQEKIPIACIAGSSVGSMLGAAYASGAPLERIIEVCRGIRLKDFSRWRLSRMGLASNERMGEIIRRGFLAQRFEDMKIPLAVVTTDLSSGEACIITQGDVVDPIRASCAYPGLFEPVEWNGRCLADGGLVAPVPTQAVAQMGSCCVVGVNVGFNNWNHGGPKNVFQVVARSINAAQKNAGRTWERFANLVIEPEVRTVEWDDFARCDEMVLAGAEAARRSLPRIRELIQSSEERRKRNTIGAARLTQKPLVP
ncbi:MAG TPA: patatin-like phospholipase family protein [Candidatus Nitrosotenuis sp.]|nr:patatin-like phospholipase family protein [Candidatus Nitrosotenuis sp.]